MARQRLVRFGRKLAAGDQVLISSETSGVATPTADELVFVPFDIPYAINVASIEFEVTAVGVGSTFRVGLYESNSDGTEPGALLDESAAIDTETTAEVKSHTVGVDLSPGRYWIAGVAQIGTAAAEMRVTSTTDIPIANALDGTSFDGRFAVDTGVTGALPDPAVVAGFTAASAPAFAVTLG